MKKEILVVMPLEERHRAYLESCAPEAHICYIPAAAVTGEDVCRADIIIGNVPPALLGGAKPEWLQLNSAGADAYVKPGVLAPGTILTNATGAYGLAVSEGMLALTLMLCRKMDLYARNQAACRWQAEGAITSVWGSSALVVGLGDIGRAYAARMKALGSRVIGIRRNTGNKPDCVDAVYDLAALDDLLGEADIVAISLPGTPETYHLMDARRLALMKKGSYLINAGRGSIVDCDALDAALRKGDSLGGCALDVTDPEPLPAGHPLWSAPRTIITPHVAGNFYLQETVERIVRIAGENLRAYVGGDISAMRNIVRHTAE